MKKALSFIIIIAMLLTAIPFVVSAEEATLISTREDLLAMTETGNYKLANDITLEGTWELDLPFGGTFDGDGKTIYFADGLQLKGGLFSQLRDGATVKNLTIKQLGEATYTPGNHRYESDNKDCYGIGVLASVIRGRYWGGSYSRTTVENVAVYADVEVNTNVYHVGGFVGYVRHGVAVFQNCTFNGSITVGGTANEERATGGILGGTEHYVYGLGFYNCINYGEITSSGMTGGIFGGNKVTEGRKGTSLPGHSSVQLDVRDCMNFGSVTGIAGAAGGIIGKTDTSPTTYCNLIYNNINYGRVTFNGASGYAGGIAGYMKLPGSWNELYRNINYGYVTTSSGTVGAILAGSSGGINGYKNYCDNTTPNTAGVQTNNITVITDATKACAELNEHANAGADIFVVDQASGMITLKWAGDCFPYQKEENYLLQISLSLNGYIGINFGVMTNFVAPNEARLVLEKDGTVIFDQLANDCFDEANKMFICRSLLNAKEMTVQNTYTISLKYGSNVYWTETAKLSVEQYANAILRSEAFADWHPLMRAMLQYGAATQLFFNYHTDQLAADLSQGIQFDASALSTAVVSGDTSFLASVSGTLSFESATDLNAYFQPVVASANLSATVKDQDGQIVADVEASMEEGFFVVRIQDLPAEKLGEIYEISVTDGAKTAVLHYGALCWVKMILDDQAASETTHILAKAIGAYANAAKDAINNSTPLFFATSGNARYSVVYESDASDYLKGTVDGLKQLLKEDGIALPVRTDSPTFGKVLMLTRSASVSGWKISFDENDNITITGNTDVMLANGFLYFSNQILGKVSNGDYMISSTDSVSNAATEYTRDGWVLAVPAYEGGTLASQLYDAGTGISADKSDSRAERSYMMCVSNTTKDAFNKYTTKLINCGYVLDSENTLSAPKYINIFERTNLYRQYRKGTQLVYVYFNESVGEARIIEDRASVAESEFEYTFSYDANTAAEVYMYGMKYNSQGLGSSDIGGDPNVANNGSFFIIKQADGSVILIDGGSKLQATATAIDGLYQFLRNITGISSNEKIKVACWFITHPHEDHYALVSGVIAKYHANLDLQRVMYNFPNPQEVGINIYEFRGDVQNYYPDVMFAKCHSGQSIQLGSVKLDVLMTHEDMVNATTGKSMMTEGNSMSTVIRYTLPDGTRFLNLGDYTAEQQLVLIGGKDSSNKDVTGKLNKNELSCNIVEVAHHGYNMITDTYKASDASYALWTNYSSDNFPTDDVNKWKKETAEAIMNRLTEYTSITTDTIYYAGLNTVKLLCQKGRITVELSNIVS